jgi:CrcB protein
LALVFLGGALGGTLRVLIDNSFGVQVAWELVTVNVVGSAVLGLVAGVLSCRPRPLLYAALGPGLLGGFTTFSGLAAFDWHANAALPSAAVLVFTTLAAVGGAAAGWLAGVELSHGRLGAPEEQLP